MDYVVSSAQAHGLKLIINFFNNVSSLNPHHEISWLTQRQLQWNDYGGKNAYVNAFGGNGSTWYTNTAAQTQYKTYIKAVVDRYKTSTAVFAWELGNEPRCDGCDT